MFIRKLSSKILYKGTREFIVWDQIPQVIGLLKEKIEMGILEPSNAPYSNKWFTIPKKNGSLRFIQDLQHVNRVTI